MKKLLFIVLFFLAIGPVVATEVDSLFSLYKEARRGEKEGLAAQLQDALVRAGTIKEDDVVDFKGDLGYADMTLYNEMGLYAYHAHNYEEAIDLSRSALEITSPDSLNMLKMCYNVISVASFYLGRYEDAIGATQKHVEVLRQLGDMEEIASPYNVLAAIYNQIDELEQALEYNKKAVEIMREANSENTLLLAGFIGKEAETLINLNRFDEALELLDEALELDSVAGRTNYYGLNKIRKGHVFYRQKQYEKAIETYKNALEMLPENSNIISKCVVLNHIGSGYVELGNFNEAQQYLNQSLAIAEQYGVEMEKILVYEYLSRSYEDSDPSLALDYYKKYVTLNDSIRGAERQKQFDELAVRYQTQEKENEIALQKAEIERRRNISTLFLLAVILLAALCLLLITHIVNRKHRNRDRQNFREQKERLLAVLTHDLKAPVQGQKKVMGFICNRMDQLSLEDLKTYCTMVRDSNDLLDWQVRNLVQLIAVMREGAEPSNYAFHIRPTAQICLDEVKNSANMKHITLENNLDDETLVEGDPNIIKTVLRNLLSNAVKYTHEDGRVSISIADEGKRYRIAITDNGMGMNQERLDSLFKGELVSNRGTAGESGNGFGLYACSLLLGRLGLELAAQSTEGQGSTFTFTINKPKKGE